MTLEDTLALIKAGYTKDEINSLSAGTTDTLKASSEDTAAGPESAKAEAAPEAAGQPSEAAPETPVNTGELKTLLENINSTLAALQAAAVRGDSRGAAQVRTAGQKLAAIIAGKE